MKTAVVVGLARSGRAAALALRRRGVEVVAVDREPSLDADELLAAGVDVRLGDESVAALDGADVLVKSPGVPRSAVLVRAARDRGLPVWSEIELGVRLLPGRPVLGVTGTNGKTTTTELLGAMFRAAGRSAVVAGNVGTPLTGVDAEAGAWLVLELSSFQLEDVHELRPAVGVLLNLEPDHLDRHGTLDDYRDAKLRLFARQQPDDTAVVPSGFGPVPGAGVRIEFDHGDVLPAEPRIPGPHNRENAAAATAAARAAGMGDDAIAAALREFPGVAHRLEPVGERRGVRFVNDSKATNTAAARRALVALDAPLHLILGGSDKGERFTDLALAVASADVRAVYLVGETAPALADALGSAGVPYRHCGVLAAAVDEAARAASAGEVVLLSPACASYDQFTDFEARGDEFRRLVAELPAGLTGTHSAHPVTHSRARRRYARGVGRRPAARTPCPFEPWPTRPGRAPRPTVAQAPQAHRSLRGRTPPVRAKAGGMARGQLEQRLLVLVTLGLVAFGLVMVYSATSAAAAVGGGDPIGFLKRQGVYAVAGLVLMIAAARFDYHGLRLLAPGLVVAAFVLCVAVLVVAPEINGARRWLQLGPVTFQPSELAKVALCVWIAAYLARRPPPRSLGELAKPVGLITVAFCGLLMLQPDLGTTITLCLMLLGVLVVAGTPTRVLVSAGGLALFLGGAAIWLEPYRRARLLSFLDPWADPEHTGFQSVQAIIGFGSGGLTGEGLGEGVQKVFYLPEAHTDMIFAIVGEELGLLGSALVIAAFAVFAYAGFRIALRCRDPFGKRLAAGITTLICGQAGVNLAAVLGIAPLTGIPLPFVSYGGSSLVCLLGAVGILHNIAGNGRVVTQRARVPDRGGRDGRTRSAGARRRGSAAGTRRERDVRRVAGSRRG